MTKRKYVPRHVKIAENNIEKLNQIKDESGRSHQWIINAALDYFFEHEWDRLVQ